VASAQRLLAPRLGLGVLFCVGGVGACVSARQSSASTPTAAGSDVRSRFDAVFEHCGDKDAERLLQSIDVMIEGMKDRKIDPMSRIVAWSLQDISEHPALPQRFRFTVTPSTITMAIESKEGTPTYSVARPSNGEKNTVTGWDGKGVEVSFQVVDNVMVQEFSNRNGVRNQRSTVDEGGEKLITQVTVSSKYFRGRTLRYTLHYCRVPLGIATIGVIGPNE